MKKERFLEIMQEIRRARWQDVLDMKEGPTGFKLNIRFCWNRESRAVLLTADGIVPYMEALSDEDVFCMEYMSLTPDSPVQEKSVVTGGGSDNVCIRYSGDIQPHWKQLRIHADGEERILQRNSLYPGLAIQGTPLRVYAMDDMGITLMNADGALAGLIENHEAFLETFPGVEALLEYDHDEFPALWTWLYVDHDIAGESTPWYRKIHQKREDIQEGMVYLDSSKNYKGLPVVTVKKMEDRSITLELSGKGVKKQEVVLNEPNARVTIWEKEGHALQALIYSPEPRKDRAEAFFGEDPAPSGCQLTMVLSHSGEERMFVKEVREGNVRLKPDDYKESIFWNWPSVWGFTDGKMVVGRNERNGRKTFLGLLPPAETRSFKIDDYDEFDEDHDDTHYGEMSLRWENVKKGFEIQDGILKSVPDMEEITVPEDASEIEYDALLTAPSLRRITIHAGVKRFWGALSEFHSKRGNKLDVTFLGSLQQWFDLAHSLSGHIGKLVIGGKEQSFYHDGNLIIPEGITRIGKSLFENCDALESVVLPKEVVSIGDHAFAYCRNLRSVKVLGPADIGPSAFTSCKALEELFLADGVKSLGYGCLDYVTSLKSVFIPKSVETVLIVSSQNDGRCWAPTFLCEAPSRPEGWVETWNLSYFDPRFGIGHGYDYYHDAVWGCER